MGRLAVISPRSEADLSRMRKRAVMLREYGYSFTEVRRRMHISDDTLDSILAGTVWCRHERRKTRFIGRQ